MTRSRRWPAYMRAQVYARDLGVCAVCALDTEALKREVFSLSGVAQVQRKRNLGWPAHRLDYWDADHITPVAEDGPCELENLRTLCLPCHKQVTAELMQRLNGSAILPVNRASPIRLVKKNDGLPRADGHWWIGSLKLTTECPNCWEQMCDVPAVQAYLEDWDIGNWQAQENPGWKRDGWLWWYECENCGTHTPWVSVTMQTIRQWNCGPWKPMP